MHRRLRHGQERPRRCRACDRCRRLVHRRHLRRGHADAGGAAAGQLRPALRAARIHGATRARPRVPRLHVDHLSGPDDDHGVLGAAAGMHRHRRHERALPLRLRHQGAGRRHRLGAGCCRVVRPRRDPVDAEQDRHRQGGAAAFRRADAEPPGVASIGHAGRARIGARLHGRHRARLRAHHRQFPLLCRREARLQDAGGVRQGRRGRRRRP